MSTERIRVFFIMVRRPDGGWRRVGPRYRDRAVARSWVSFVGKAWHSKPRISQCTLTLVDGRLDERSVRVLDEKYNMDPPADPPREERGERCDDIKS